MYDEESLRNEIPTSSIFPVLVNSEGNTNDGQVLYYGQMDGNSLV